jgi:methyl-accepting chemotaxis protein
MTIGKKLIFGFTSLLALLAILGAATLTSFRSMNATYKRSIEAQKREQIRGLVELAYTVMSEQHAMETAGKISLQDAQAKAINTIRGMRYGNGGYLWINDFQATMVLHPAHPELEGRDLSNYKDPTGKRIFVEFADVAKNHGNGFVAYFWPKPGESAPVRKISFVKGFSPWEWVVGTGVYTDDVDASSAQAWTKGIQISEIAIVVVAVFAIIAAAVFWLIVRRVNVVLCTLANELSAGAEQVACAASQVSSSSLDLAHGASEQAASLEETSSSSMEVNSMTRKNADNAKHAGELMGDGAKLVVDGNRKLQEMITSMREINISSQEISKINKVIDEIAFQTNILALNAAIEAARAGTAGMGFGVVAEEVRNLAQRCAHAAEDTSRLIEGSLRNSRDGQQRLDEVAIAISAITENTDKVKLLVDEVNLGSHEQARGMEQITRAISQMEQVTQKTAASAEQSAAAGQQLDAQSNSLRSAVSRLSELIGAANGKCELSV